MHQQSSWQDELIYQNGKICIWGCLLLVPRLWIWPPSAWNLRSHRIVFFWLHTPSGVQVTSDLNESCWQIRYSRICVCIFLVHDSCHPKSDTSELMRNLFDCSFLTDQLERVFLRLGHAETDEQLQDIISKFLPPVLLKLSSVQEGVRKKVSGVLSMSLPREIQYASAL